MSVSPTKTLIIPTRTLSLRRTKQENIVKKRAALRALDEEVQNREKRLRLAFSYDSDWWQEAGHIDSARAEVNQTKYELGELEHELETAWRNTPEARQLVIQMERFKRDAMIAANHALKLENDDNPLKAKHKSFLLLYLSSRLGLSSVLVFPKRKGKTQAAKEQSKLRQDALQLYNSQHPEPDRDLLWCPILSEWRFSVECNAGHIYPYASSADVMVDIFGVDEMMSPQNCMIISNAAEKLLEDGVIALVPDVDNCSKEQIREWREAKVKEYRIKIIDKSSKKLSMKPISGTDETWHDLDGKKVMFRSEFRPRARYLYWSWCTAILKLSYHQPQQQMHADHRAELNRPYWGTVGGWLEAASLRPIVEAVGHDLAGCFGQVSEELPRDDTALLAMNSSIATTPDDEEEDYSSDDGSESEIEWRMENGHA